MRFHEASALFIEHCGNERGLSPNTISAYRQDMEEFCKVHGQNNVQDLTGTNLVTYIAYLGQERGFAPATVKRRLACLKSMFGWLKRRQHIKVNPFSTVEIRVRLPNRLPKALSRAEMAYLVGAVENAPKVIRLATLVLLATGARIGELTAIRMHDVDVDSGIIRIFGKGSRERQVFITNTALLDLLRKFVRERQRSLIGHNILFTSPDGNPISPALIRQHIKTIARRAGLEKNVTPHVLRHTAATALIEAGVDIRLIQRLLGHQSIATTQIYVHVADEVLRIAIARADTLSCLSVTH